MAKAKKKISSWKDIPFLGKLAIIGIPAAALIWKLTPEFSWEDIEGLLDPCDSPPQRLPVSLEELTMEVGHITKYAEALYMIMNDPRLAGALTYITDKMVNDFKSDGDYRALNNLWEARIDHQNESVFCWLKSEWGSQGQSLVQVLGLMQRAGLNY
jgi:hypothetical protein